MDLGRAATGCDRANVGGCIEVVQWILTAGRFDADPAGLAGGVLLVESSEEIGPPVSSVDPAVSR